MSPSLLTATCVMSGPPFVASPTGSAYVTAAGASALAEGIADKASVAPNTTRTPSPNPKSHGPCLFVILLTSSQALTALARRMLLGEGSPSCGDSTSGRRPLYVRRCTAGNRACVHPCVRDCPSARKSRHGYHPAEVRFCWSVLFSAFLLLSTNSAAALSVTGGTSVRVDAGPMGSTRQPDLAQ